MADACEDPLMDLSASRGRQRRVLVAVLSINALTFVMVAVAAWFARSTALLSGGLDNLGDALTYALSLAVVGASLASQARVSIVKGFLILGAALIVAAQVVHRLLDPTVPVFETMGAIGLVNLGLNAVCLWLLTPFRHGDVNMASAWECSRNDIYEGTAVLAAAGAVWLFDAGWPDLLVAAGLLALFLRSALKVLRRSFAALREANAHGPGPGRMQDPVCKCWVDPATAPAKMVQGGATHYFCDAGCLRRFKDAPEAFT
jgi:Co/Zn/Cd efflux system component